MDLHRDEIRQAPPSWSSPLQEIPEPFRAAALQHAWQLHERTMARDYRMRRQEEQTVAAEHTALSALLFARHLPYHQLPLPSITLCSDILRAHGPSGLLSKVNDMALSEDRVLVVGDSPPHEQLRSALICGEPDRRPRTLIAGPGSPIGDALLALARAHSIPSSFIEAISNADGISWDIGIGPLLDSRIGELFNDLRPTRLAVMEPARLPATVIAIEKARELGLPVDFFAAIPVRQESHEATEDRR